MEFRSKLWAPSHLSSVDEVFGERLSKSLEKTLGVRIACCCFTRFSRLTFESKKMANPGALRDALKRIFGTTCLDFLEMLAAKEILAEFNIADNLKLEEYAFDDVFRRHVREFLPQ